MKPGRRIGPGLPPLSTALGPARRSRLSLPQGKTDLLVRLPLALHGTPPLSIQSARKIALSLDQVSTSGPDPRERREFL